MKFIRPYGQSVTNSNERKIVVNGDTHNQKKIIDFANDSNKLMLGLAISTLDKTIGKKDKDMPVAIFDIRDGIGTELLNLLFQKGKLTKTNDTEKDINIPWKRKIHPYGSDRSEVLENETRKKDKKEHKNKFDPKSFSKKFQGRYYPKIAGTKPITDLKTDDFKRIANNIFTHIFVKNLTVKSPKGKGLLEQVTNSIEKNTLKIQPKKELNYTEKDIKDYSENQESNFIAYIYSWYQSDQKLSKQYDIDVKKNPATTKPTYQFTPSNVLKLFKENYELCFENKKIKDLIAENNPEFFAHEAVRDYYIKLLELHRNKRDISYRLPKNTDDLKAKVFNLNENIKNNKNITAQIRLGKIIHYTNVCPTNTDAIKNSHYWTSTGQIEIKRSEAFVKSWFNFITFASHSLTYLSKEQPTDIMGFQEENFEKDRQEKGKGEICPQFADKIKFILGNNHGFDNHFEELHEIALKKLNRLRNMVFHFHSREAFLEKLQSDIEINDTYFKKALNNFVQIDLDKHYDTLWESLCGVGIKEYMHTKEDIQAYWNCVTSSLRQAQGTVTEPVIVSVINLPKFITVLKRADNTRCKIITPPTVAEDNKGEKQCQYTMLKNLYERPFKAWFSNASMPQLTAWIDAVKKRTTDAAELLNKDAGLSISMENMPNKFKDLSHYLVELTRLETQRGSVQNGYASDKKAQKKKSNAVENFKMDVIIRAFDDFLNAHDMDYLKKGLAGTKEINNFIPNNQTKNNFKPWQQELYLLLHFVPVGIACDLEHQLTKYFTVRKNSQIQSNNVTDIIIEHELYAVFELYRNNNDNKFEGAGEKHPENITEFYENIYDYQNIFEKNKSFDKQKAQAQHRHVREMVRFGVSQYLKDLPKITHEPVEKWQQFDEKEIEQKQKSKAKLHDDWVNNKKEWSKKENEETYKKFKEKYQDLVRELSEYNTLDNQVRLVDFRKIHKLVMQILGRLVGYSFMYERDLYFITLAHLHEKNLTPTVFFEDKLEKFEDGQIINAFANDQMKQKITDTVLNNVLKTTYYKTGKQYDKGKKKGEDIMGSVRNNFAHFNMLRKNENFNITDFINKARDLMAYDRKLKNAVAKSIKTIFEKEGIDISFDVIINKDKQHELQNPIIKAQDIKHLGGDKDITEPKHSKEYIEMIEQIMPSKA